MSMASRTAKGMEKWIEIFSFSWGASNPTTVGTTSGGLSAGKASVSSFNIMKKPEKSSPNLFARCCTGQHYDKANGRDAEGDRVDGGQKTFLKYTFERRHGGVDPVVGLDGRGRHADRVGQLRVRQGHDRVLRSRTMKAAT